MKHAPSVLNKLEKAGTIAEDTLLLVIRVLFKMGAMLLNKRGNLEYT